MVLKMLELSTAHITENTAKWIDDNVISQRSRTLGDDEYIIAYPKHVYGWFIPLGQSFDAAPGDLKKVVEKAEELKCQWIMFDRDADEVNGLKTYNW